MKKSAILVLALLLGGVVFVGGGNKVEAAEATKPQTQSTASYKYVAQSGDSYTKMARKAVQTYGKKNKLEISLAGVIFAETNITKDAGSPRLSVGQQVTITEQTVKQWVERAQKLTPAQLKAWDRYTKYVDFNTDRVGQARQ